VVVVCDRKNISTVKENRICSKPGYLSICKKGKEEEEKENPGESAPGNQIA